MMQGKLPISAVQQAESQRDNTAQLVPQIEQGIQIQENSLQLLAGSLPGAVHRDAKFNGYSF